MKNILKSALLCLALTTGVSALASDNDYRQYEITITNVTVGQTFTPLLVATHSKNVSLFTPGHSASDEIAQVAESGNVGPLSNLLHSMSGDVLDVQVNGALLTPGQSVTLTLNSNGRFDHLSMAAMLIPTNDSFVAINSIKLPKRGATITVPAYDAGTEVNDELCANIPGPVCGGEGNSVADGEGYVHVARGIHGIGDLDESTYDWRNPVASITIKRAN